ncbi:MAG: hypothetical protein ACEQSR_02750 [Candidatus Methylacidiphilales bacterium]
MKHTFCVITFIFLGFVSNAQKIDSLTLDTLKDAEIRLSGLAQKMVTSLDEMTRISSGKNFIRTLARTLKTNNSYFYNFDSLKNISIVKSPDDYFRILTWNVASDDEHFRNFGVIQMNPNKIKREKKLYNMPDFFPIIDRSDSIEKVFYAETDADHWFGAIYYKIIRTQTQKGTYYTLLGWDGATSKSNKKVIDVLFFKDNEPYFGAPIFDIKTKQPLYRMIWEFNNSATMTLRYEEKRKLLIYENIIPPKPDNAGMYETYVPDGSYDFMIWNGKVWEKQKGIVTDFKMN